MLSGVDAIIPSWLTKKKRDHESGDSSSRGDYSDVLYSSLSQPGLQQGQGRRQHYGWVLPVIWMEFMAISLTRAIIPPLLVECFDTQNVYVIMGCVECVRGGLAFVSCPLMGRLSDEIGRRPCLFLAVLGTCFPLVFQFVLLVLTTMSTYNRMVCFVITLALSGLFCTTFTLTFAYIADTTSASKDQHTITPYGFALATFGFAFTIGPITGASLKNERWVFGTCFLFVLFDLLYIAFLLPESKQPSHHSTNIQRKKQHQRQPPSWEVMPWKIFSSSRLVFRVGMISFYYYIALWGVLSTLTIYITQRFHMTSQQLGHLLSLLGFSTMLSEAVLVQFIKPGYEIMAIQLGLASFTLQCILLGCASQIWHLYPCILLSIFGNLVYPSLTSLIVSSNENEDVGQVLGAIHGIKAATEGIGPLCFGLIFSLSSSPSSNNNIGGWPFLILSFFPILAHQQCQYLQFELDYDDDDDRLIEKIKEEEQPYNDQEMVNLLSLSSSSTES